MKKSYIREKKYRCGSEYMAVGIYAVTDQEHRRRGKKHKESDRGQKERNKHASLRRKQRKAIANFGRDGFFLTGTYEEFYLPEDFAACRRDVENYKRRVIGATVKRFGVNRDKIRLMLWAVRKGETGRLHMHGFAECVGMGAADRREWREMLEDLWRRRVPGTGEYEPLGTMNADRMDMKKLLGVDELHFYDVYTPLLKDVDKHIPYEQAKQTVYDALAPLGDDYRTILKNGFDHRWIDVYQNEGKRSGAYSAGTVVHPYVLLNYTGTLDSQFTLAHEMGHALHSYLSNKHQNPIDADYVIFVAEVASTCNEALLMEYLLGKTTDKKERAYLINHFLDQFKGTLYRQTMFAEFELNIGKMAAEGQTLTADVLCAEYKRLNELYYGPDMVVDDNIAMEWARIPHFYYNYYVFQYATGYSAAIALSRRILREGAPAVKDYLGFLSGGCSADPITLLRGAGVDMASPKPIEDATKLFDEMISEMEKILN